MKGPLARELGQSLSLIALTAATMLAPMALGLLAVRIFG